MDRAAMTAVPPVSPGISEDRMAEIEKLAATMFYGDSVMVEVGVNLARASRELLAEVRRLRQQVERLRIALERTEANFKSAVNGRPVPDMGENLVENALALGSSHG